MSVYNFSTFYLYISRIFPVLRILCPYFSHVLRHRPSAADQPVRALRRCVGGPGGLITIKTYCHYRRTFLFYFFGGSYISCRESTNSKIQYHHKYFCSGEVEPQHRPSLAAAWNNFSTPLLSGIHIDLTGETLQVRQSDDTIPITIHNHNSSPANFSVAPLFSSKL